MGMGVVEGERRNGGGGLDRLGLGCLIFFLLSGSGYGGR